MGLSRLLLIAANSKKYISGYKDQKLRILPKNPRSRSDESYTGEVVLCFQLDDTEEVKKKITHYCNLPEDSKRCDGLIFLLKMNMIKKLFAVLK